MLLLVTYQSLCVGIMVKLHNIFKAKIQCFYVLNYVIYINFLQFNFNKNKIKILFKNIQKVTCNNIWVV